METPGFIQRGLFMLPHSGAGQLPSRTAVGGAGVADSGGQVEQSYPVVEHTMSVTDDATMAPGKGHAALGR